MIDRLPGIRTRNKPPQLAIAGATTTEIIMSGTTPTELFGSGAPVNGVTGAGVAGPGSEYTDNVSGKRYHMLAPGTQAVPQWFGVPHDETGS